MDNCDFDYATHGVKVPANLWGETDGKTFASLFVRAEGEEDEDADFFLSPRMALKLFNAACSLAGILRDAHTVYGTIDHPLFGSSVHPRVCTKFFQQQRWVDAYIECYYRVAARLAKVLLLAASW
jgi:hypothetical protein